MEQVPESFAHLILVTSRGPCADLSFHVGRERLKDASSVIRGEPAQEATWVRPRSRRNRQLHVELTEGGPSVCPRIATKDRDDTHRRCCVALETATGPSARGDGRCANFRCAACLEVPRTTPIASQESPAARADSTAWCRSASACSSALNARPISRRCRPSRAGVVAGARLSSQVSALVSLIVFAMVVTSHVVVELGSEHIGVNHPLRCQPTSHCSARHVRCPATFPLLR